MRASKRLARALGDVILRQNHKSKGDERMIDGMTAEESARYHRIMSQVAAREAG